MADNELSRWIVAVRRGAQPSMTGDALTQIIHSAGLQLVNLSGTPDNPRAVVLANMNDALSLQSQHENLQIVPDLPLSIM